MNKVYQDDRIIVNKVNLKDVMNRKWKKKVSGTILKPQPTAGVFLQGMPKDAGKYPARVTLSLNTPVFKDSLFKKQLRRYLRS